MHYKRKKYAKISTNSFYLSDEDLKDIEKLCFLHNQSRNNIFEWAIRYYLGGDFERAKKQSFKKAKKILAKKKCIKSTHKKLENEETQQECLFNFST